MATERLDMRLDRERRRKLQELAAEDGSPVSAVVRRLIDKAYEDTQQGRRRRAALELGRLEIEDVPSPEAVSQELEDAHEPGGLH